MVCSAALLSKGTSHANIIHFRNRHNAYTYKVLRTAYRGLRYRHFEIKLKLHKTDDTCSGCSVLVLLMIHMRDLRKHKNIRKFLPFAQISCHAFRRFNRLDRLLWFCGKTFHQPSELLWRQRPDFRFVTRPDEFTLFKSFVEEKKTIFFPNKTFNATGFATTEKVQGLRNIGTVIRLLIDDGHQRINPGPEIYVSANNVNPFEASSVI